VGRRSGPRYHLERTPSAGDERPSDPFPFLHRPVLEEPARVQIGALDRGLH
jgi:hypothetical protein